MTLFETLKLIHILAATAWIGGGILGLIYTERAKKAEAVHRLGIARDMEFAAQRVFSPAAGLTLIFGILMVLEHDGFEFTQAWILVGLSAIALSAIMGMGFLGPQSKRLVTEIEADDPGAVGRLRAIARVAYLDNAILLVAVWAMVFKPGF